MVPTISTLKKFDCQGHSQMKILIEAISGKKKQNISFILCLNSQVGHKAGYTACDCFLTLFLGGWS